MSRSSPDDVLAVLAAILDEVRALHRRIDALEPRRPVRVGLLYAIAMAVDDREFSADDVIAHAEVHPALAAALDAAYLTTARTLGKYLARVRDRVVDDVRIERLGEDNRGVIWRAFAAGGSAFR